MTERFAAIDVGTNTIKLVVAERDAHGSYATVHETAQTTRLGEGMHARRLREAAIRRTLDGLREFVTTCRELQVSAIAAVGTAALRESANGDDFVSRARAVGVEVLPISGDEEARLSFLAVCSDPLWREAESLLVIDIGGGSTEVIYGGRRSSSPQRTSIPLGAVKLTEIALRSDPPTLREMDEANDLAAQAFHSLARDAQGATAVGVGGTLVNLAAVDLGDADQTPALLHGHVLSQSTVESQCALFGSHSVAERKRIAGLDPARADIILGGATILSRAMAAAACEEIAVSCRGLRWGLLYDRFGRDSATSH
jgi:exopolyphosphatase / guanosine-5'-triphosphate,3'-diphosphate pyrophosphatase